MNTNNDVDTFMEAADQKAEGFGLQADLYMKLIEEEFNELKDAFFNNDIVEIADACFDLKWVIEGLEKTLNIPRQEVWDEGARSNLAKISPSGKVEKREDGKVMKPATWTPPDFKTILRKHNLV